MDQAEAEANGETIVVAPLETEELAPLAAEPRVRASSASSLARLGFARIDGIPASIENGLSDSLRRAAFRRSMFLVPNGDQTQTHIVKGYLSLAPNSLGTIVVFVWDISANNGQPPHRVTGQILDPDATGGWQSIDQSVLDQVAVQSMEAIIGWLNSTMGRTADSERDIVPFR